MRGACRAGIRALCSRTGQIPDEFGFARVARNLGLGLPPPAFCGPNVASIWRILHLAGPIPRRLRSEREI